MPVIRLTKRTIKSLPHPRSGQEFYRDDSLPGFGLRVGARSKAYFVETQVQRRTVRVTIGRFDLLTPEAAKKSALALLAQMAEGKNPNVEKRRQFDSNCTVEEAFAAFFAARPQLAKWTVEAYRRTPARYLADWQKLPLGTISRQMVLARHRSITDKFGQATANSAMRHLRSVYNFAAATHDGFLPNPVGILSQARAWHRENRRRTVIAKHQLSDWWRAVQAEDELARDFLLTALLTGMRRSEVASLKWENVDLIAKTLHLPKTKNGDPLDLPMSDYLAELISARRELVGQSEWVFPGRNSRCHIVETKTFVRRVVKASSVPFSLHDLRRTFITVAESLDIPAYALRRLLNHRAHTDVTSGYIVIDAERLRAPVQRVATHILELCDETTTVRRNI